MPNDNSLLEIVFLICCCNDNVC